MNKIKKKKETKVLQKRISEILEAETLRKKSPDVQNWEKSQTRKLKEGEQWNELRPKNLASNRRKISEKRFKILLKRSVKSRLRFAFYRSLSDPSLRGRHSWLQRLPWRPSELPHHDLLFRLGNRIRLRSQFIIIASVSIRERVFQGILLEKRIIGNRGQEKREGSGNPFQNTHLHLSPPQPASPEVTKNPRRRRGPLMPHT